MSELGKLALQGLTSGGVDTAVKTGGGLISSGLNYLFQKKLMKRQNAYNIAQWNREVKRQNELLNLQAQFTKNSLRNAGYSTANPEGMTTQATTSPSGQTPDIPSGGVRIEPDAGLLSQLRLQEAQAKDLEASAIEKEEKAKGQRIDNDLRSIYGAQEYEANLARLDSETKLNIALEAKAVQDKLNSIALTDANVREIDAKIDIAYQKLQPELQLMAAQTFQAQTAGKLNQADAALAYQTIKESQQRIEKMKVEMKVDNAQIALLKEEARLRRIQGKTAAQEARLKQIEADAKEKLGPTYYAAKEVVETVIDNTVKVADATGNLVSSFIPGTDKVQTTHNSTTVNYDSEGNMKGYSDTNNSTTTTTTHSR